MTAALGRFRQLPRATRWVITALVAFFLYFVVVEPALDVTNKLSARADTYESMLANFAASDGPQQRALGTLGLGTRQYGEVEFLGDEGSRPVAFNRAVDKVLEAHSVSNTRSRTKKAPLGAGPLTSKLGNDVRIERIVRDVEFDASPETVAAVIADLERSPVVAAISRVQVRHIESRDQAERQVHAVITAEAWIQSLRGRGG